MLGAVMALFVALGSEAWWTLTGATTSKLFSIQVSPFFVQIAATGMPSTVPLASDLGSFTRTFLLIGFVALFAASIRPTAWWRSFALYFGYAAIAELYLSFFLMLYWAESVFSSTYGITPPFLGTSTIHANLVGLDLGLYTSPLVTATFSLTAYLGLFSIALLLGRNIMNALRERSMQVLAALLPGNTVHDITLTPPYQQVWYSSTNDEYNPMRKYLGGAGDDQLLISFGRLFETVEPGGSLSVILPEGSTILSEKLDKIMPEVGFTIEEQQSITSPQGKPEIELRFRRPAEEAPTTTESLPEPSPVIEPALSEQIATPPTPENAAAIALPQQLPSNSEVPLGHGALPTLEVVQTTTQGRKVTRLERTMLRSAIRAITEHHQPVPYRELLNEVYMDLVDQKVEFDSARQIETTLLDHNGREVVLLEENDASGAHVVKKWGLGSQKLSAGRGPRLPVLNRVKAVGPKITSIRRIIRRPRKSRYTQTNESEDDSGSQSV